MYIIVWLLAILIEFIVLTMTNEVAVIGVIIITFGLMFLACLFHGDAASKVGVIVMSAYCFLWGGLLCLDPLVRGTYDWGVRFTTFVFAGGFGIAFILLGIYTGIIKLISCSEQVEAVYIGATEYQARRRKSYSPQFVFRRNNQEFSNTTGEVYSKKKLEKLFQEGNTYTIYVNPKNPLNMLSRKKISGTPILLMVLGVAFVLAGIYGDF